MRVAINGFGRIGRMVLRAGFDQEDINFVAINDLASLQQMAYLLKYDSIHGGFKGSVSKRPSSNQLVVQGASIETYTERKPEKLPWDTLDIDVVIESTGIFRRKEQAAQHLRAGAPKVLLSAPPKGESRIPMIVYGVNQDVYDEKKHDIVSNASCTTNSLAPMAEVLHNSFGIKQGQVTTVHAYTGSQTTIDGPRDKIRRGRAAAENIIPTSTGSATAVVKILPELRGKLDAMALRVPVPDGSITDLVAELEQEVTADEVNEKFERASKQKLKGVLDVSSDPLVSRDIVGNSHSCIIDRNKTNVVNGNSVKVLGWYDNEYGFACRMIDVAKML